MLSLPSANLPPYPQTRPSVMPPQPASELPTSLFPPAPTGELQSRSQETQNALSNYTDKFHVLDSLIAEHDSFKHDVDLIKVFVEERKRENSIKMRSSQATTTTTPEASLLSSCMSWRGSMRRIKRLLQNTRIVQSRGRSTANPYINSSSCLSL